MADTGTQAPSASVTSGNWLQRHWLELLSPGVTLGLLAGFLTFVYTDMKDDLSENKDLIRNLETRLETSTDALRNRMDGVADAVSASREALSARIDSVQSTLNDRISREIRAVEQRQVDFAVQMSSFTEQLNKQSRTIEGLAVLQKGSLGSVPGIFLGSEEMFNAAWSSADRQTMFSGLGQPLIDKLIGYRMYGQKLPGAAVAALAASAEGRDEARLVDFYRLSRNCSPGAGGDVCESVPPALVFGANEQYIVEEAMRSAIEANPYATSIVRVIDLNDDAVSAVSGGAISAGAAEPAQVYPDETISIRDLMNRVPAQQDLQGYFDQPVGDGGGVGPVRRPK